MQSPNFNNGQFVDALTLNDMAGAIKGSMEQIVSETADNPGLIQPEDLNFAISGNQVTVTMPSPFAVQFGSGVIAAAYGTTNGATSDAITLNFAPLIPGSGSVTAYILAAAATVQQSSYTNTGAPLGHPDFDPNFVPALAYMEVWDTLNVTASLTAPDNVTTFALGSVTLSTGQSSIAAVNTTGWVYASSLLSPTISAASLLPTTAISFGVDGRLTGVVPSYGVDTGAVNALVVALSPAPPSLFAGMVLDVKVKVTNTGASTLNVNSLGAVSIINPTGSAMVAGELPANAMISVIYDGTYFQLVSAPNGLFLQVVNNLSDVANVSSARTNLGLGTMAVQNANAVAITGGSASGLGVCAISSASSAAGFSVTAPNPVMELIDRASGNAWVTQQNSSNAQMTLSFNGTGVGSFDHITGVYSATSDLRLKENIVPLGSVLEAMAKLNPVSYSFKADESKTPRIGLIAQELQEHFPQFVTHIANKMLGENEQPSANDIPDKLGVDQAGLSILSIKAIQELIAKVAALESELVALKAARG